MAPGLGEVRQHDVFESHPDVVLDTPGVGVAHSDRRVPVLDPRQHPPGVVELRVGRHQGVQVDGMGHVEVVLDQVKPVGRKVMAGTQVHRVRHLEGVVHRKRGLAFRGAEEGEDDAAILVHRVRPDADLAPYGARLGFQRRLEEAAVDTVEPPVIAAANPLLLNAPVLERRPPVHAVPVQQTEVPLPGAEEHQVLPEQRDGNGQVRDLGGKRHRVPEAPQVLPAGRARTDPGELDIFRGAPGMAAM